MVLLLPFTVFSQEAAPVPNVKKGGVIYAKQPDPWQIIYVTHPMALRQALKQPVQAPDSSQIIYVADTTVCKRLLKGQVLIPESTNKK